MTSARAAAAAAVKAALVAAGVAVVDERARVTGQTTFPFVVLDAPDVLPGTDRVQRHAVTGYGILQTVAMGVTTQQASWLQDKVEAALQDAKLVTPGWVSDPVVADSAARWLEPFTDLPDRTLYQCATRWRVRLQQT